MSKHKTESSKLGHAKVARIVTRPCPGCHQPATYVQVRYPVRKSNGAIGEAVFRGFAHPECL